MTIGEVRKRYIEFFKSRGHTVLPSAPIVPGNDPTTLFTSSGMQPLVPYLLGQEHPEGTRLVNSQLSIRTGDIEEVGDNRHTTFFEMLGNWSLGDYFKQEQLSWLFEFLTSDTVGVGFDPRRIYVTVFEGDPAVGMGADKEAVLIWKELFEKAGVSNDYAVMGSEKEGYERGIHEGERIFAYDSKKNWWSRSGTPEKMPAGEPGGPDSEVFYDFGTPHDKSYGEHCHPNCDCGRFVEICNSVFMQVRKHESGTFETLPKLNVDFGGGLERFVATTIGSSDIFDVDVFEGPRKLIEAKSGKSYHLDADTKRQYRIILDHVRAATFVLAEGIVPSKSEAGYILRRLLRRTIMASRGVGCGEQILPDIAELYADAYSHEYPYLKENIVNIRNEILKESEQFVGTLALAIQKLWKLFASNSVISKITPEILYEFYTTDGFPPDLTLDQYREYLLQKGQEPLSLDQIESLMQSFEELMLKHQETSRAGGAQKFAGGLADHAEQTVKYHTTHHILLAALQRVLGSDVRQRGSNITSERLRIDFSHGAKMTDGQKTEVEKIVNDTLYQDLPVTRTVMSREEAERLGAQMEFGVKYPDMVSVYSVGPVGATESDPRIPEAYSLEFCGGPHVGNTREIHEGGKHFKIKKEEAVASGVRRIKAVVE